MYHLIGWLYTGHDGTHRGTAVPIVTKYEEKGSVLRLISWAYPEFWKAKGPVFNMKSEQESTIQYHNSVLKGYVHWNIFNEITTPVYT